MNSRYKDIKGDRYGRLTVLEYLKSDSKGQALWKCLCDCGNKFVARTRDMRYGNTRSCGCLASDHGRKIGIQKRVQWKPIRISNDPSVFGIPLGRTSKYAIVDKKDLQIVKPYRWILSGNGYVHAHVQREGKNDKVLMHRLLLGLSDPDVEVDHVNHNRQDNRRCNIRICSRMKNCWNTSMKSNNTSGCMGVYQDRTGKWIAHITVNKEYKYLGRHVDFEDAVKARKKAEIEYFKGFKNG